MKDRAHLAAITLMGLFAVAPVHPQSLAFEVVSIKPSDPDRRSSFVAPMPGGRFVATGVTLRDVIGWAYQQPRDVVTGGPSWVDTERFDIEAKAVEAVSESAIHVMAARMLVESFKMRTHIERRDVAGFALAMKRADGTLGPDIKRIADACRDTVAPLGTADDRPTCLLSAVPGVLMTRPATSMNALAQVLRRWAGGPVLNQTGLAGVYELQLRWKPDAGAPADFNADFPALFTAIEEQLGLTLTPQRVPEDIIVIDAIERPEAM